MSILGVAPCPIGEMHGSSTTRYGTRLSHGKPFTPHSLRHLFATTALKNGTRLDVISKVLGHRSTAITSDIYVHTDMADMQEAVDRHSPKSDSHRTEK